jgi:hypothetical protein
MDAKCGVVYVAGQFDTLGGVHRHGLGAVLAENGAATAWDPDANNPLYAVAESGGTIYAGGWFMNIGGEARSYIAALDSASGDASPWNPHGGGIVRTLNPNGTTVYAGGDFTSMGGQPQSFLAAIGVGVLDVPIGPPPRSPGLAQAIPNPARSHALIRFTLPSTRSVTLAVYDLQGRRVATVLDHALRPSGANEVEVRTTGWRAGCYFYRLEAGGTRLTRKMVVLE